MSTMDFFGDFCLSCDRQTNGTTFCSQACRLAELDHYTSSEPASPSYSEVSTASRRTTGSVNSGFYLPPAFDFSLYRSSSYQSLSSSPTSGSHTTKLSEQALNNLKDYVGSFDQTRTLRRRVSMQSNEDSKSITKA